MDIRVNSSLSKRMFQLTPTNKGMGVVGHVFSIGRMLIGRSEGADFIVSSSVVSSIHAVLEVTPKKIMLYDMNSRNGTFVNGEKIVTKELHAGDKIMFGNIAFNLGQYTQEEAHHIPPVLDTLEPMEGKASTIQNFELPVAPSIKGTSDSVSSTGKKAVVAESEVPYVVYPLSQDPNSEFSEYIFEDAKELFPIFKYQIGQEAVEVIIIHEDKVYSVDYIPNKNGTYHLIGARPKKTDVEFPYLGVAEKFPFVEISSGNRIIHQLPNYNVTHLSDEKISTSKKGNINLQNNDIVKLVNGDLEIYVRNVPSPPKVKTPPFFRLENELKKYILLVLLFIFLPLVGLSLFEVDKEIEKEKAPERIATILYKPDLAASKAVEKTEEAPKKVQQAPRPKPTPRPKRPQKTTPRPVAKEQPKPKQPKPTPPGVKTAPKEQVVKKVARPRPKTRPTPRPTQRPAPALPTTRSASAPSTVPTATTRSAAQKNIGHVDVYKSVDFKSTVNNIMAKGGSLSSTAKTSAASTSGETSTAISGVDSRVQTATTNGEVGSLTGAASGKLDVSKGAEGLSAKKGIYTAGIPAETVVVGSIDPDVIRRILQEHIPQFSYCYQQVLDRGQKEYTGILGMEFTIGASGHVTRASIGSGSDAPTNVRGCVARVLRGIQFPRPMGGGTVDVNQPLNLKRNAI